MELMLKSIFGHSVSAPCPDCKTVTSFDPNPQRRPVIVNRLHSYAGKNYTRTLFVLTECSRCGRGGLATIHDNGTADTAVLESFYPPPINREPLPKAVPADLQKEFEEAELCASIDAFRAAAALFRSTLEKVLKANGYTKEVLKAAGQKNDLFARIDLAIEDGVLSKVRGQSAHNHIRILANDVLHDEWREVSRGEVDLAHHYTHRILEDLYRDRPAVETILTAQKRLPVP